MTAQPVQVKAMVRLLRPHQFLKNLLVFAPAFFDLKLAQPEIFGRVLGGFVCFCAAAGAVYIFNDWIDVDTDRAHPRKRFRPLASGEVTLDQARVLMAVCALSGLVGAFLIHPVMAGILGLYLALNLAYSLRIKKIALLDVVVIAIGFVLRLFMGGAAASVTPSMWLVLMTFLLAMFLALAKRRHEVEQFREDGVVARDVVDGYNPMFLNAAMTVMAAVVLVCYFNYTISPEVTARMGWDKVYLSTLLVLLGMLRYLQLCFVYHLGDSPTRLLIKDRLLQSSVLLWLGFFAFLLYMR